MQRLLTLFVVLISSIMAYSSNDDYNDRQAKHYTQEAEYYQKKAEVYQREAAYYTRKGDTDRAKDYNRRADRAMDDYKTQMRYAANADDKAADYLKRAARLLQK